MYLTQPCVANNGNGIGQLENSYTRKKNLKKYFQF